MIYGVKSFSKINSNKVSKFLVSKALVRSIVIKLVNFLSEILS